MGDGRGFILEQRVKLSDEEVRCLKRLEKRFKWRRRPIAEHRVVVTAAHCLEKLPPAHAGASWYERTCKDLLGSLDGSKNGIWAECLFADPVADIAVFGCPDTQELGDEADAYHALTDDVPVLRIGNARNGRGWVLTLDGRWVRTTLELSPTGASLSIGPTEPGMSGSPILNDAGRAVGVVVLGSETMSAGGERKNLERAWGQPILTRNLPGWLLQSQR